MPYEASPSPFPEDGRPRPPAPGDHGTQHYHRRPLSWPRALGHGVASGAVLFLLLVLSMTFFADEGLFALIFLGGLVVPPAIAAHHYGRRSLVRAPRDGLPRAVEPAVLAYAREVQALDYRPGTESTEDDLSDYQLALDVYDKALTQRYEEAAATLAEGWTALARLRTPNAEWNHGSGPATLRLTRPEQGTSAVLAFTSPALGTVRLRVRGERGTWTKLYEAGGPVCARLPLPAREDPTVQLEIRTEGAWRAAVLGGSVIRELGPATPRLTGYGGDLLRLAPAPRLLFQHTGHGPYQVRRLTSGLRPMEILAEGMGEARLWLTPYHRDRLLQIQARDGWSLSTEAEARTQAEPKTGIESGTGAGTGTGTEIGTGAGTDMADEPPAQ